ncbi:MAG: hypothetical protein WA709_33595 [Stellaceae bacterium]
MQQPSLDRESESENQYNHGESDITQLRQFIGLRNVWANSKARLRRWPAAQQRRLVALYATHAVE